MAASLVAQPVHASFAAYVAHELRTPLTLQRALLELALSDARTDATAWREIGEDVLRTCVQQERMIEVCLRLARSCSIHRSEPVDLAAIASDALGACDVRGLERTVALEPARTIGDPDLVERLAANLLSNAVRHNVAGGRIEVATHTEAERAVLSVANTGRVIPPGSVERLFQPFERLGANGGSGLGLAIVRAVAGAHDAHVTARARTSGGLAIEVAFHTSD